MGVSTQSTWGWQIGLGVLGKSNCPRASTVDLCIYLLKLRQSPRLITSGEGNGLNLYGGYEDMSSKSLKGHGHGIVMVEGKSWVTITTDSSLLEQDFWGFLCT